MLLYIMLYIVLAYLMLFAALTNAVCLLMLFFLPLISENAFYFHALSLFISVFLFASCTVLLICLFNRCCFYFYFYFYIFYERAMSSLQK